MNPDPRYARALLSGMNLDHITDEFTADVDDSPIDLSASPREEWPLLVFSKVLPTPAIQRYLDSGDLFTHEAINKMELALETHYGIIEEDDWYITSERKGKDADKNVVVSAFILMRDPDQHPH